MDFKIDTKDSFTTIVPLETGISANMAGELWLQLQQMRQSGSANFIIDLQHCAGAHEKLGEALIALHEESYGFGQSIVFTGINNEAMAILKNDETAFAINIAPSMREAIDIISMEILERDLLEEE